MHLLLHPPPRISVPCCKTWRPHRKFNATIVKRAHIHSKNTRPFDILFFGRDEFSCIVLNELYTARDVWSSISIATNPDVKTGRRGAHLSISPLKTLGESLGVPVHTIPREKPAFRHWLPPSPFSGSGNAHHLLITASFGRIIPAPLLHLFPEGRRLNVHPSLLPSYRGPAPIQRALMQGERDTGVCIIDMMEVRRKRLSEAGGEKENRSPSGGGIDAGSIWGHVGMPVPRDATFSSLRDALAQTGGKLLVAVIRDMLAGRASCTAQAPVLASTPRASAITATDALVDFEKMSAEDIERLHRAIGHQKPITAFLPTGKSLQLHSLSVLPAQSVPFDTPGLASYSSQTRALLVPCAGGGVLSVGHVKQQDRALLASREWWNGVKGLGLVGEEGGIQLRSNPDLVTH
ncbi:Formyltransferase [Leucogyrophana mollusca]|uniref:Formyltransferase n=1 Tax=Leucogyrophana mollusca TaxID=85980 RepID=A0ACB8B3M8_9AGAM|nr:Formyltransferase [Leucogyrophana mollusca]